MASTTIDELLRMKEVNEVYHVSPEATVKDALQVMSDKDIGAVLVLKGGQIKGIFSERDYARKILIEGQCFMDTPVEEVMTTEVITINSEQTVEESMTLMTRYHIRHLPVLSKGKVAGVISIGDLVKAIISGQAKMIDSLENYITGSDYGKV